MPLVVPGITNKEGGSTLSDWQNKLMGKKIGDTSDAVTFAKKELPDGHRVLKPGDAATMDYKPDRVNVHVGDDGTVKKVTHG